MTGPEWGEVVDWVEKRFPDSQWHPEQAVAYFQDVKQCDPVDVWAGLQLWYEQGQRFAPTGSVMVAEARKQSVARHRPELRSLPSESVTPAVGALASAAAQNPSTWDTYTQNRFGKLMTAHEVIVKLHTERTDCLSPSCDIHKQLDVG